MVVPVCPKCDNHHFVAVEETPAGCRLKLMLICCGKCGSVVGVAQDVNFQQAFSKLYRTLMAIAESMEIKFDSPDYP